MSDAKQPTPPVTKNQSLADILNEIESRANAATPGPWKGIHGDSYCAYPSVRRNDGPHFIVYDAADEDAAAKEADDMKWPGKDADVDFIASARTDVPKLVKALREAQMGFEVIAEMAEHSEPLSSNYAKVKLHDLSLILTSPENGEQQRQSLGEH